MNRLICPILFLLLTSLCPASDLTLSLSGIGPRVRSSHPALKAARLTVDEARGRHLASGRLANPTAGV
jgi:cobalt-zinc-cadmium efflux system outer membrane protein